MAQRLIKYAGYEAPTRRGRPLSKRSNKRLEEARLKGKIERAREKIRVLEEEIEVHHRQLYKLWQGV